MWLNIEYLLANLIFIIYILIIFGMKCYVVINSMKLSLSGSETALSCRFVATTDTMVLPFLLWLDFEYQTKGFAQLQYNIIRKHPYYSSPNQRHIYIYIGKLNTFVVKACWFHLILLRNILIYTGTYSISIYIFICICVFNKLYM